MSKLLPPDQIRAQWIEALSRDFASKVADFERLATLVTERGGTCVNDHAAIRVADPTISKLIAQALGVMGMESVGQYAFPQYALQSTAYHVCENHGEFALFVSNVDLDSVPEAVRTAIEEDNRRIAEASDHQDFSALIAKAVEQGGFSQDDTDQFIDHFIQSVLSRNGVLPKRALFEIAAEKVDPVLAAAMLLGTDVNHITIDLRKAGYGSIQEAYDDMKKSGFLMKDVIEFFPSKGVNIRHTHGPILDQSSVNPAEEDVQILEDDGSTAIIRASLRFVEIIYRHPITTRNIALAPVKEQLIGEGELYPYFVDKNAQSLFKSAATNITR